MAKRKRVALIYAYNENWIGGTYYIENLIAALGQLSDDQQPELLIFTWEAKDAERLRQSVTYPYWSFRRFERPLSLFVRAVNKFTAVLLNKRIVSPFYNDAELVFPLPTDRRQYFSRIPHHLYWIPDFQEHYLPDFFKADEIEWRKADQQLILRLATDIVFSSTAAQNDFNAIYPANKLAQYVLNFAVSSHHLLTNAVTSLAKYDITTPYFICSNQFWKHKDHPTVLRALSKLLKSYPQALVIFTGKEEDYRNPSYFDELTLLRQTLDLGVQAKFLGFIPRKDQLVLMQNALAVIQPSLFEGWSTVVEDAKSLNVPLIASAIDVHKEQLIDYGAKLFFKPSDDSALMYCMAQAMDGGLVAKPYFYQKDVLRFAQDYIHIITSVTAE